MVKDVNKVCYKKMKEKRKKKRNGLFACMFDLFKSCARDFMTHFVCLSVRLSVGSSVTLNFSPFLPTRTRLRLVYTALFYTNIAACYTYVRRMPVGT